MKNSKCFLIIITVFTVSVIFTPKTSTGNLVGLNSNQQKNDTIKLPESITKEELKNFRDHRNLYGHAGGPEMQADNRKRHEADLRYQEEIDRLGGKISRGIRHVYSPKVMDQAWTLMLLKQGIISLDDARIVLSGVEKVENGSETDLGKVLDEKHASIPFFGKTMVEPMPRIKIRNKILDVIDAVHHLQNVLLKQAENHSKTIMPSMTHMADAQITTYGSYLLAVNDGISRGLEDLELAYKHANENNGGCGATSGAGFPVDRDYVTELLGFDKTHELCYDAEPGQDWVMSTLSALSNIAIVIGRASMDYYIWGMSGYATQMMEAGASSFMPQKAHAGSEWEMIRINVNNILGANIVGILALNKAPLQDNLDSYQAAYRSPNVGAMGALCDMEMLANIFAVDIEALKTDKEKLLQLARDGWGCTPDLVVKLVLEKGLDVRQAHRMSAVMVRIARIHRNNMKPYELTGAMLDEAARLSNDPEPHLTTKELREIMDPVKFIERHNQVGEPNPKETIRMVNERLKQLNVSKQQQVLRRGRVDAGYKKLRAEIDKVLKSGNN